MKANELTILEVLSEHGVNVRNGSIRCPSHDDRDPSASIVHGDSPDGFVFCHACQWSGDAIGLKAALEGRTPADVLRSMDRDPTIGTTKLKPTPPWKLRRQEKIRWAIKSQPYFQAVNLALPPWVADLAIRDLDEQHLYMNDQFRDEEIPPMKLRDMVDRELRRLEEWANFWLATAKQTPDEEWDLV